MLNAETINSILKLVLAFITLSLGFSIKKSQILNLFIKPKPLLIGLVSQMIILPCIALLICALFNIDPLFKLGIMIIAICPGGTTANLLSYLIKANVSLSISLTIANGILCLLTIPLMLNVSLHLFSTNSFSLSIPYSEIITDLFLIVLLPGTIGIILNHFFSTFSSYLQKYLRYVLPLFLVAIFAIKFFASPKIGGLNITLKDIQTLLFPLLLLNIFSIAMGYLISNIFTTEKKNSLTIAIETGLQNTALALIIGISAHHPDVQKPALIYAAFSFFTTAILAYTIQKKMPSKI